MRSWALRSSLFTTGCAVALVAFRVWGQAGPGGPGKPGGGPSCRAFSATAVSFGVYNPLSAAPLDSMGSVGYKCPRKLAPPRIEISVGVSGTYFPRAMKNPGDSVPLQYNLYVDAARTSVWGDGTSGTSAPVGPPGNATLNVFGRVPPFQDIAVGTFSDTVMVTFYF